jgi:hypothetical protein
MNDHVIRIRHPFFMNRLWRVVRMIPSLKEGIELYRIQLLKDNGEDDVRLKEITIPNTLLIEDLGRFDEWRKHLNND